MILILDNYDSFTYNLVHLVSSHTHNYKVLRNDAIRVEDIKPMGVERIIISPGPGRPEDAGISEQLVKELGPELPILGVCLGHQAIGHVYGCEVIHAPTLMHGKTSRVHHNETGLFEGVEQNFPATRYHSLVLDPNTVTDELRVTAYSDEVIMGIEHKEFPVVGIQFHPESILTQVGPKLMDNWLNMSAKAIKDI